MPRRQPDATTASPTAGRGTATGSAGLRLGRQAWRLLHLDSSRSLALAERALEQSTARGDLAGLAWAHLARGFHRMYFAVPEQAKADLDAARAAFARLGDRAGEILATAGVARGTWRFGRVQEALDMLLPLRDEGVRLLRHEQRGALLNAIAGCYSTQGRSEEAFAYMYEALRSAGPSRGHGFDAALHCNLSHELLQLGDHEEALAQVGRGLARCEGLRNNRLVSVLLVNRVVGLTELGRAAEALPDIDALLALPLGAQGRGLSALAFESMAIAAFRAGEPALGERLVTLAESSGYLRLADERLEYTIARALGAAARGDPAGGLAALDSVSRLVAGDEVDAGAGHDADAQVSPATGGGDDRASLRLRCLHAQVASELYEAVGDRAAALKALRHWQRLNAQRARQASRARYQAAALQTELLKLQHRLEENDAKRRETERARAELAVANEQLSRKMREIETLQAALREQATHDALTGLANRRHLNDTLPQLLALALRERTPLAVVLIDLDHFKLVNDQHGHDAGDHLLAAFGRLLRKQLRASDLAFRHGGEEFCLLMPHTRSADAARKAATLLQRWRSQVFRLDAVILRGQTFSAGVADTTQAPLSPEGLLKVADSRLLDAKREGRARVVDHGPGRELVA